MNLRERINVSLPSLRIDAFFSLMLWVKYRMFWKSSLTFAPEADSKDYAMLSIKGSPRRLSLEWCRTGIWGGRMTRVKLYLIPDCQPRRKKIWRKLLISQKKYKTLLPKFERSKKWKMLIVGKYFILLFRSHSPISVGKNVQQGRHSKAHIVNNEMKAQPQ